ncbi:MAG: hypothetical protein KIT68_05720 [Phycisphaeraceae bacterium]|nr:hypothetical protein [Phycisphaeraceae bacterium]
MPPTTPGPSPSIRLYDGETESLLTADLAPDRVSLLPGEGSAASAAGGVSTSERIRIMWGQDLLRDVLDGRYRTIVCGVNDEDNSRGVIAQIVELVRTSQWSSRSVTSYAKMFQESVSIHAARDREPYVLKYDLDSLLILALLRPRGRDHFTLEDLSRGFATVAKMLRDRRDRLPVASVSFLNARANRLVDHGGKEPSFEAVLRTMFTAGFRGDVFTSPAMWKFGHVGVFPTYPFPAGVSRMREGSS